MLCRLQTTISGATGNEIRPRMAHGNMEERRKGWDRKCWNIERKLLKMKNTEET
jgi:hypothetical protein